jgi:hypothetical protein
VHILIHALKREVSWLKPGGKDEKKLGRKKDIFDG